MCQELHLKVGSMETPPRSRLHHQSPWFRAFRLKISCHTAVSAFAAVGTPLGLEPCRGYPDLEPQYMHLCMNTYVYGCMYACRHVGIYNLELSNTELNTYIGR